MAQGWRNPVPWSIFPVMRTVQPQVRAAQAPDGTQVHLLDHPPHDLPPVHARDLAAAWDTARHAAIRGRRGTARQFRFRNPDGTTTGLALHDRDAACWAAANAHGLQTTYGVSLCLRLLALVELLTRAPALRAYLTLDRGTADLHPALLRAAAAIPLTEDARFDEARIHGQLTPASLPSGALA